MRRSLLKIMKFLIPVTMLICGTYLVGLPLLFYAVALHRDSRLEPLSVPNPKWVAPAGLEISILAAFIIGALLLLVGLYLSFRLLADDRQDAVTTSKQTAV